MRDKEEDFSNKLKAKNVTCECCAVCGNVEKYPDDPYSDGGMIQCETCLSLLCVDCTVIYPPKKAKEIAERVFEKLSSKNEGVFSYPDCREPILECLVTMLTSPYHEWLDNCDSDILYAISSKYKCLDVFCPICQNLAYSYEEILTAVLNEAGITSFKQMGKMLTKKNGSIAYFHEKLNLLKNMEG